MSTANYRNLRIIMMFWAASPFDFSRIILVWMFVTSRLWQIPWEQVHLGFKGNGTIEISGFNRYCVLRYRFTGVLENHFSDYYTVPFSTETMSDKAQSKDKQMSAIFKGRVSSGIRRSLRSRRELGAFGGAIDHSTFPQEDWLCILGINPSSKLWIT